MLNYTAELFPVNPVAEALARHGIMTDTWCEMGLLFPVNTPITIPLRTNGNKWPSGLCQNPEVQVNLIIRALRTINTVLVS